VHIWRTSLDSSPDKVEVFRPLLASDELARAERLIFPEHKRRFILARGHLRRILSSYLNIAPNEIRFDYGVHGKPRLSAFHAGSPPLHFNLAHSGEIALYAVTGLGEVGVDVERIRPDMASIKIAERYFSVGEVEALKSLSSNQQTDAFFNCWTRKEAFLKATGQGLTLPLDQFEVSLTPGEHAQLLRTGWDSGEAAHWTLCDLKVGEGYRAALALRGHDYQLQCWDL
jgi:4'-phosphopantetheinyl transferase